MHTTTLNHQVRKLNPNRFDFRDSHLSPHIITGHYGELYLIELLEKSGYIVWKCETTHLGDLCVVDPETGEFFSIEVKCANANFHGRYQFCLNKPGHTNCTWADWCALLCIDNAGTHYLYIVQPSLFQGVKQFSISSHPTRYKGKFAPMLVRGHVDFDDIRVTTSLWGYK